MSLNTQNRKNLTKRAAAVAMAEVRLVMMATVDTSRMLLRMSTSARPVIQDVQVAAADLTDPAEAAEILTLTTLITRLEDMIPR